MDSYKTIKERATFEYEDRKSVFIGDAMPVSTESEALAFIDMIKKKYKNLFQNKNSLIFKEDSAAAAGSDKHSLHGRPELLL